MNYKKKSKRIISFVLVLTLLFASGAVVYGAYEAPYQKSPSSTKNSRTLPTLSTLPTNSNILYENDIYYVLCDGATTDDRPTSDITSDGIGLILVWKDHHSIYGPYNNPQHLADEVKEQSDYLISKKAITSDEAKLLTDVAADIQLFYMQNSERSTYDTPVTSRSKEYAKWGIRSASAEDAYYYNDIRVRLLVDFESDHSFATFHYDKKSGIVDLRIMRDQNDAVQKVEFLTEVEANEILGLFTNEILPSESVIDMTNSADAKALELMQNTGNWNYIEPFLPQMINAGIDAVVSCYNSKHFNPNEYKKASDYYNDNSKAPETVSPNDSESFDYSVFNRLDTMTSAEVDALALSYIAATGQFGHIYNLRPYMTTAGIDAAVKAYLNSGGDVGVVLAILLYE